MPNAVSTIRNLGPAMQQAFEQVGLETAEDLRALGADAAYARLLRAGERPHFMAFCALEMGLQGRPWNDCAGDEKTRLRDRFDRLRRDDSAASNTLDAALHDIGVIPSHPKAATR